MLAEYGRFRRGQSNSLLDRELRCINNGRRFSPIKVCWDLRFAIHHQRDHVSEIVADILFLRLTSGKSALNRISSAVTFEGVQPLANGEKTFGQLRPRGLIPGSRIVKSIEECKVRCREICDSPRTSRTCQKLGCDSASTIGKSERTATIGTPAVLSYLKHCKVVSKLISSQPTDHHFQRR
jgi:hypothetical protein